VLTGLTPGTASGACPTLGRHHWPANRERISEKTHLGRQRIASGPREGRREDGGTMPIEYLVSQVEGWREELAALPPPDPGRRKVGKHQAVIMMAKELQAAARQGYTTRELLELLAAKGLKIHVDTLREALRQARRSARIGQVRSRRPDRVRMRTEPTALSMQAMRRRPRVVLHERSALLGPPAPTARLACRSTAQLDPRSCCSGRRRRHPRAPPRSGPTLWARVGNGSLPAHEEWIVNVLAAAFRDCVIPRRRKISLGGVVRNQPSVPSSLCAPATSVAPDRQRGLSIESTEGSRHEARAGN
jgi:hypothetical protein